MIKLEDLLESKSSERSKLLRELTEQELSGDAERALRSAQAAGGATRGASITMGGISRGASIEMRANKAMLEGSIPAAGHIRDASLQAARLHMAATIVHHMTRDAARRIEQGLTMRY